MEVNPQTMLVDMNSKLKELHDNGNNLKEIALHCQENYANESNKQAALNETKRFATQALASVAYQINVLTSDFMKLMDMQENQLEETEGNVYYLSESVVIHKEKVARRDIGLITAAKSISKPVGMRANGIIYPKKTEESKRYERKPINYALLDSIGHGVDEPARDVPRSMRNESVRSHSNRGQLPQYGLGNAGGTLGPRDQIYARAGQGTLGRSSGQYYRESNGRSTVLPPVAPPSFPVGNLSGQHQTSSRRPSEKHSSYSSNQRSSVSSTTYASSSSPGMQAPPTPSQLATSQSALPYDGFPSNLPSPLPVASPTVPKFMEFSDTYIETVRAIHNYKRARQDELDLEIGTVIHVVKKNDDGWWEGVTEDNQHGLFPSNYVTSIL